MAVDDLRPEEASTEFLTNNQTWNKQASFEQLGYFYCVDTVGQGLFFNACESAQNMSSLVPGFLLFLLILFSTYLFISSLYSMYLCKAP